MFDQEDDCKLPVSSKDYDCILSSENEGTEKDFKGVSRDMSIPLKLFIDWLCRGNVSRDLRTELSLVYMSLCVKEKFQ